LPVRDVSELCFLGIQPFAFKELLTVVSCNN